MLWVPLCAAEVNRLWDDLANGCFAAVVGVADPYACGFCRHSMSSFEWVRGAGVYEMEISYETNSV